MLPALLDAATPPNDATTYVISGLGVGFSAMATLICSIAMKKFSSLTKAIEKLSEGLGEKVNAEKDERHKLEIVIVDLKGFANTAHARLTSLESNTLTKPIFDLSMAAQNRVLGEQTEMLKRHDARLTAIGEDLVGHEEQLRSRSRQNLPAVRTPIPRTDSDRPQARADGPSRVVEPYVPPPMRPQLKSQQIK